MTVTEKVWSKEERAFLVFVDLEKAFDFVLREAIQWALRRQKVPERFIAFVMAQFSNARLRFRTLAGTPDEFGIGVGVRWQDKITNEEGWRTLYIDYSLRKMRLRWLVHVKCRDENNILRRGRQELEVEGRRPLGRPKKTYIKVVEKDMRKFNITEDMAEDRKQWKQLVYCPTPGVGN